MPTVRAYIWDSREGGGREPVEAASACALGMAQRSACAAVPLCLPPYPVGTQRPSQRAEACNALATRGERVQAQGPPRSERHADSNASCRTEFPFPTVCLLRFPETRVLSYAMRCGLEGGLWAVIR
jgi:hypothetical protein